MSNYVHSILLVFAGLFPIVNPAAMHPIFLTLTRHCSMGERHSLAGKVAINSFILLTGSLFLGSYALAVLRHHAAPHACIGNILRQCQHR